MGKRKSVFADLIECIRGPAIYDLGLAILQMIGASVTAADDDAGRRKPDPPELDAPTDDWFDWYHTITDHFGYRKTLKELANEMGLTYDYVRHLHRDYTAQHSTEKTQK